MERDIKENPWKGLASYTYQDADHFYGRDKELDEIASIIKQNAFTTLYGVSGAGKTSIINAGLFPILDKLSYLPIYIRLDHNQGHIGYDSQIIDAVNNALNAIDAELEESIGSKEIHSELDELWLYFHSHQFWTKDNHKITPIIFIDQFEEIFTKNDNPDDIWSFFNVIDSLQYSTPTERLLQIIENNDQYVQFHEEQNFRMVFTMREDFLARLEDYSYNIPALRKNRIGLKPLNGNQALEVILKPMPDMVTRDVALHIISKVTGKTIPDNTRRLEATSVDTSILSLFCTELYNYAVNDNKGQITIPLVDLYGGNILEWFYDRNMQILPKKTYVYLENQLLTHSGFRNSVALENLLESGVQQEQLDRLAENRIIRIEDINHNYRVEFTHDVLCKIAKKRRDDRDKVERNKDEQSARRAFTIDNIIMFTTFLMTLIALYFGGINRSLHLLLCILPLITFLFLLIIHRSVADRNFSKIIWIILGGVSIEAGIIVIWKLIDKTFLHDILLDNVNPTLDATAVSILSVIPLLFVLSPFFILISIEKRQRKMDSFIVNNLRITFATIIIAQAVLFGLLTNFSLNSSLSNFYYTFFFLPSIIMALTPFIALFNHIKKGKIPNVTIFTCCYSFYAVAVILFIIFDVNHHLISSYSENHAIDFATIAMLIIFTVLCIFYAIQYAKQPQNNDLITYWESVANFQSFSKYKSHKTRLLTIIICFVILGFNIISSYYNDFLPFITLPLASLLLLISARTELSTDKVTKGLSLRILIPIIIITEIIVISQYYNGWAKQYILYFCSSVITVISFLAMKYHECSRSKLQHSLRVALISLFIGFALPVLCIGYNVYNPQLKGVNRVWGCKISSDVRNLYFLTIEDRKGNKGLMDNWDIIIPPEHAELETYCSIDQQIAKQIYPVTMFLIDLFDIGYNGIYRTEYEPVNESIFTIKYKHKYGKLSGLDFLTYDNRFGQAFLNLWKEDHYQAYNGFDNLTILSATNKCFSEDDKKAAAINIFVNALYQYTNYSYDSDSYYLVGDYTGPDKTTQALNTCINQSSLAPLYKKEINITLDDLHNASLAVDYLFSCTSHNFYDFVLEMLWNKLQNNITSDNMSFEDKSFFYLLSRQNEKAIHYANRCRNSNPRSINALCNLYIAHFVGNKTIEMKNLISSYNNSKLCSENNNILFYALLYWKLNHLKKYHVIENNETPMSFFDKTIKLKAQIPDYIISNIKELDLFEAIPNTNGFNSMAYNLATEGYLDLAKLYIDKAVLLESNHPDYLDTKGYILLLQGKEKEAEEIYYEINRLDDTYFHENNTDFLNLLIKQGIIDYNPYDMTTSDEDITE